MLNVFDFFSKVTKEKGLYMVRETLRKTDVPEEVGSVCIQSFKFKFSLSPLRTVFLHHRCAFCYLVGWLVSLVVLNFQNHLL